MAFAAGCVAAPAEESQEDAAASVGSQQDRGSLWPQPGGAGDALLPAQE